MSSYTIKIETNNDAFGSNNQEKGLEVARILRILAKRLERGGILNKNNNWIQGRKKTLYDTNGNQVGTAIVGKDF